MKIPANDPPHAADVATDTSPTTLVVRKTIKAAVARVFAAWTESAESLLWWARKYSRQRDPSGT